MRFFLAAIKANLNETQLVQVKSFRTKFNIIRIFGILTYLLIQFIALDTL